MKEKCKLGLNFSNYDTKNYPKACNQRGCPFNNEVKGIRACTSTDPNVKQSLTHPPSICPVMQKELARRAR